MSGTENQLGPATPLDASEFAGVAMSAMEVPSAGVASLDSSSVQQTKSEIRSLAAEIAQLSYARIEPSEYFEGLLPRLCSAMGAKGAGAWRVDQAANGQAVEPSIRLVASHALPRELLQPAEGSSSPRASHLPTEAHYRILACVVSEGQPILVPPGGVQLEAKRPANPLPDALLIIPVRIQDEIEYLLQVVQRPSGGPAAQRGYLRFVAQMADLMADYLRRHQLRQFSAGRQRVALLEQWLLAIAQASPKQRPQLAADALRDLLGSDRVLLLNRHRRSPVFAVSGVRTFDPRSEITVAAAALMRQVLVAVRSEPNFKLPGCWTATDRRSAEAENVSQIQLAVDELCAALGCRAVGMVAFGESPKLPISVLKADAFALVAYTQAPHATAQREEAAVLYESDVTQLPDKHAEAIRLASSIGVLLATQSGLTAWLKQFVGVSSTAATPSVRGTKLLMVWLARAAVLALLGAVAMFPVSQQISATAVLQPVSKQLYYAPAAGLISEVLTSENETVERQQPLLRITSHDLEVAAENFKIELRKAHEQIEEKTSLLNRGDYLRPLEKDQLEFELRELETTASSLNFQLEETQKRLGELSVVARSAGIVATWDLQNRLLNQPVVAGQLLLSTYDPDDKWRLQLSIPDHRAGLVAEAMQSSDDGVIAVNYSLASHPDHLLQAFAAEMAPQVTVAPSATGSSPKRIVTTVALIPDASQLPLKKDGAIARATVDCGQVPLAWLVFRDAYWALSSRVRMLW